MKKTVLLLLLCIIISFMVIPHITADINIEAQVKNEDNSSAVEYIFVLSDTGDMTYVEYGSQILPEPDTGNDDVLTHLNCYAVVSDPNNVEDIQKKGVVNALGEAKLFISDKGKVEPEAIENIIQNDLFKTSFNLTKQQINKIVA